MQQHMLVIVIKHTSYKANSVGRGSCCAAKPKKFPSVGTFEVSTSTGLQGQRAQRIEMLLLHEFYKRKFMLPDKLKSKDRDRLAKEAARTQQMNEDGYIPEEEDKPGTHPQLDNSTHHFALVTSRQFSTDCLSSTHQCHP